LDGTLGPWCHGSPPPPAARPQHRAAPHCAAPRGSGKSAPVEDWFPLVASIEEEAIPDQFIPGMGHALAAKLRTATRIVDEVKDAMMLAELPYPLCHDLWEITMDLESLAERIELEDEVAKRRQ